MTFMKKNTLEAYRKAIKAKYDGEKEHDGTGFLYHPTPAGLKQLCLLLFDDIGKEDAEIFKRFFNFKDNADPRRQIMHFETDKFRPLRNFLLGGSEKSSQNNLDLLAVLVDLRPRPFTAFLKSEAQLPESAFRTGAEEREIAEDMNPGKTLVPAPADNGFEPVTAFDEAQNNVSVNTGHTIGAKKHLAVIPYGQNKGYTISARHIKITLLILLALVFAGYMNKTFFREEACMQWNGDHYEPVTCERGIKSFVNTGIIHLDEETLALQKRIKACDTTTFFLPNGKPAVWYCKMPDGTVEYFTYPGLHPVTGVTLKHITQHIIDKYVLSKDSL